MEAINEMDNSLRQRKKRRHLMNIRIKNLNIFFQLYLISEYIQEWVLKIGRNNYHNLQKNQNKQRRKNCYVKLL
jgi:hypothetical protein